MEPIVFLSHEEVCELTGARIKAKQIEVLKRNGIRHTIKASGWPCVVASAITGEPAARTQERPKWTPRKAS